MIYFEALKPALDHAAAGGQALHTWDDYTPTPTPHGVHHGDPWGHLIDQDAARLKRTAKRLGVRHIRIHRKGEPSQHIPLFGLPLDLAFAEATDPEQIGRAHV